MLGGIYKGALGSVGGNTTVEAVAAIYADLVFLGSCAIDVAFGVSALDAVEAEVKRAMVMQSRAVAVAATSDKLGLRAAFHVHALQAPLSLVFEADADEAVVRKIALQGVAAHRCGAATSSNEKSASRGSIS